MSGHGLPRSIPDVYSRLDALEAGEGGGVAWDDVSDKPAVIAAGADAATARTAIGLGSLATLSTITSANITDATIVNADISASAAIAGSKITLTGYASGTAGSVAATDTLNAAIAKLEARIAALEA